MGFEESYASSVEARVSQPDEVCACAWRIMRPAPATYPIAPLYGFGTPFRSRHASPPPRPLVQGKTLSPLKIANNNVQIDLYPLSVNPSDRRTVGSRFALIEFPSEKPE